MARPANHNPREKFLASLRKSANVTAAARSAGVSRKTVYQWREEDEAFRADWEDALGEAVDALVAEAWRRAKTGTLKPVFQGGEQVGQIREYSDALMALLLKGHRPHLYRDRQELSGPDGGPVRFSVRPDLSGCTDEELALLERILSRTAPRVPDPL